MNMIEFGKQNPDVVTLLHGCLSWWNYREIATLLAEQYVKILTNWIGEIV